MKRYDAIVIGGGHNGLITAAYLARAKKSVLVLEPPRASRRRRHRRDLPGLQVHDVLLRGLVLRPEIIRDLDLPRHGLHILPLEVTVTPMENEDYLAGLGRSR